MNIEMRIENDAKDFNRLNTGNELSTYQVFGINKDMGAQPKLKKAYIAYTVLYFLKVKLDVT